MTTLYVPISCVEPAPKTYTAQEIAGWVEICDSRGYFELRDIIRQLVAEKNPQFTCDVCGRAMRYDEQLCGPQMWHVHKWTCKHPTTASCPDCYGKPFTECPQCGCEEVYT